MIEIVNNDGTTTMTWDTYSTIMRDRYNDGRNETWNLVLGTLETEADRAFDVIQEEVIHNVLIMLREVRIAHRKRFVE